MLYVTLMSEWPKGSGIRKAWAGWYEPGCGVPSVQHQTDGECPIKAVASVYEQLAMMVSQRTKLSKPRPVRRERGLFE